jgi:predicted nucleic acid-binding protein
MRIFFDASVLVAALVRDLPDRRRALNCLKTYSKNGVECCCSTHALAECYATLTALPLKQRIQPEEAAQMIEVNLAGKLTILEISRNTYFDAIRLVAGLGFRSGMIYDALHLCCAEVEGCERLYTFNTRHFQQIASQTLKVVSPDLMNDGE